MKWWEILLIIEFGFPSFCFLIVFIFYLIKEHKEKNK